MMKIMRAPILFLAALLAPLVAASARAEAIYKWIDDQGGVHYSNSRPADSSRKAEVLVEDKISTYQSNAAELRAQADAVARTRADNLARRVDYLERELAAQRQATQYAYAPEAAQPGYEANASPYVIYAAPLVPARRVSVRHRPFQPINSVTGLPAGKVTVIRHAPRTGHGQLRTR
jgi:Domain of unknown function (DUF4124)